MIRIGIALGRGGAKGLAHIGVLEVLKEHGVKIDCIAGTSMGAIVGGLIALGYSPEELEAKANMESGVINKRIKRLTISSQSIYKTEYMHKKLYELFGDKTFRDAKTKFYALATDLIEGKRFVFRSGKLVDAVEASSRIPLLYSPKKIGEKVFVDGAVLCPVPTGALKNKCDFIISVAIPSYDKKQQPHHFLKIINVLDRSISIMSEKIQDTELKCENPDFIINLEKLKGFSTFDFEKSEEIISLGRRTAKRRIKSLLNMIEKRRRELKRAAPNS